MTAPMKKTYFVYFEQFFDGTSEHIEKNLLVESDLQGKELYRYIQVCVAGESLVVAKSIVIKNIVCLSDTGVSAPMQIENSADGETIRVAFKARPDLELKLQLCNNEYLDRMNIDLQVKDNPYNSSHYCLELPAMVGSQGEDSP